MIVCAAAALFGAAAWTAWSLAPSFCSDPFTDLKKQTPCRSYYDRQGKLLHIERTYDYQWRFDIPLEQISQEAVDVILAAEDAHFYDHNGVDLQAVARATWQNLTSGRIISGAPVRRKNPRHPGRRHLLFRAGRQGPQPRGSLPSLRPSATPQRLSAGQASGASPQTAETRSQAHGTQRFPQAGHGPGNL